MTKHVELTADEVKAAIVRHHGDQEASGRAWACVVNPLPDWTSPSDPIDVLAISAWRDTVLPGLAGTGRQSRCDCDGRGPAVRDACEFCHGSGFRDSRNAVVAYQVVLDRDDFECVLHGQEPKPGARARTRVPAVWPARAKAALQFSNYMVFAVPQGLLTNQEIYRRCAPSRGDRLLWLPPETGLIEITAEGDTVVRAEAALRYPAPWSRAVIASLVRQAIDPYAVRRLREENARLQAKVDELTVLLNAASHVQET